MMQRLQKQAGVSAALFLLGLALASCGSDDTAANLSGGVPGTGGGGPAPVTVTIDSGATGRGSAAYGVNPLVVEAGTTVVWVNNDGVAHTVTSESGNFDSGRLNPGQSFRFKFDNVGDFSYICSIHGKASMNGMVRVTAAAPSPTPTATATPTETPTESPSPSATPSPTPSVSPSPTMAMVSIDAGATGKGSAAYGTNPLVVSLGSTVMWTNNDSMPHTVTSSSSAFDSGSMASGQTFSHTFTIAGDYPYFCSIHGQSSMNGVVRVTP
jgi:plastocyanin